MQIYALDHSSHLIRATHAQKGITYTCPECSQLVRMRSGDVRQPHFYHTKDSTCRLSNKSLTHLEIQASLQKMLLPEETTIECRFPTINRIADVVWPSQKLIFEAQVSPISADEVKARNRDYAQLGYQVIWILHDKRYNRTHLAPAELALRASPHYFTNMNAQGKGGFYDQYALTRFKRRINRSPRFPVFFNQPTLLSDKQFPRHFPKERLLWPISFEGDLFHQDFDWRLHNHKEFSIFEFLKRSYEIFHHILLEKTTY